MARIFLWSILLAIALVAIAARLRGGPLSLDLLHGEDAAPILVSIAGIVLVGGTVIALFRDNFVHAIRSILGWLAIAAVLLIGYTYRFDLKDISDRVLSELVPGRAVSKGRTVELARARSGDFQVSTEVNGKRVSMVIDTGASAVVLTNEAAKAAGLPLEVIKYTVNVDTANGQTRAAAVTLDRISIGGIIERSVPALVAQPGQLKTSLLGMSFLNRLEGWEVRGDKILMRGYP